MTSLGEIQHEVAGCHWGGRPHLGPCRDRSHEAGRTLTEVRTLLSRAETALATLTDRSAIGKWPALEWPRLPKPAGQTGNMGEPPRDPAGEPFDDPDHFVMVAALHRVIGVLAPWRRGPGKTTHWVADTGPAQLVTSEDVPACYTDEVGDEMFMGQQAVLAGLRRHLAERFVNEPAIAAAVLFVADEYMQAEVDHEQSDEDDGEDDEDGL